jgi:hypothetical protein
MESTGPHHFNTYQKIRSLDDNQHPVKITKWRNLTDPTILTTILTPTRTIKSRTSNQMNQSNKHEQQSNNHDS